MSERAPAMKSAASAPVQVTSPGPTTRLHVLRTTGAAVLAHGLASWVGLPEPYWATITALVVMQSTLAASWTVSWKRLVGTAIGATIGGLLGTWTHPGVALFAAALVASGLLCSVTGLDRAAYRFAGITLAIVMLVTRSRPAWIIACHRFAEVAIGIVATLVFTAMWPEPAPR